jgi:hypothetical protein
MYDFAVVALLALAVVKLVDFVTDNLGDLSKMRSVLTFVAGIGAAWLLDYSLFAAWDIPIRDADMGVFVTGFVIAGMTVPWRALFAWFTHDRATMDETLGDHNPLRREHVKAA